MSYESTVVSPVATIETFNRQLHLGEKEREAVKWEGKRDPALPYSILSMLIPDRPNLADQRPKGVIGRKK